MNPEKADFGTLLAFAALATSQPRRGRISLWSVEDRRKHREQKAKRRATKKAQKLARRRNRR